MKRLAISMALLCAAAIAFMPAASAQVKRQRNSSINFADGSGITEFVQYNRDARDKK